MSENTMYETLMSLPLFSGASSEHFSRFVERCNLDFKTYAPGEVVMKPENSVRTLMCLVSGRMEASHSLLSGRVNVREDVLPGRFIGVERLFGLNNHLNYTAVAKTRCGTMEVDKQQYLTLVSEHRVFLLNLLNYLSRPVQQFHDVLYESSSLSLICRLSAILQCVTTRDSENVEIWSVGSPLADVLANNNTDALRQLVMLESRGYIESHDDRHIRILDRDHLIELAGNPETDRMDYNLK